MSPTTSSADCECYSPTILDSWYDSDGRSVVGSALAKRNWTSPEMDGELSHSLAGCSVLGTFRPLGRQASSEPCEPTQTCSEAELRRRMMRKSGWKEHCSPGSKIRKEDKQNRNTHSTLAICTSQPRRSWAQDRPSRRDFHITKFNFQSKLSPFFWGYTHPATFQYVRS